MSIAGGMHLAVERGREVGCDVIQVFVKNNNQWKCKPLTEQDCELFKDALKHNNISNPIAHASYLINLATPDDGLWHKSIDALVIEWKRCELLGIEGLVVHPGAHTDSTPQAGLERIAAASQQCIQQVKPKKCNLLLENTAGQGTCLGWQFSELGWLIREISSPHLGVCLDTCHAFAAGYDFRSASGLKAMLTELEKHEVSQRIHAIHINDSKRECGSRVDRHEHIGLGAIGEDGMKRFIRSAMFRKLPMYLETAKGTDESSGEDWDKINLATLRRLASVK
ncbi:MAG: deoxyribonuclease IV [Planctomycetales bacterium]|nr:deoxyribonuclease IV [Planctomycetales bacterium]